jgi:hypothetical protein
VQSPPKAPTLLAFLVTMFVVPPGHGAGGGEEWCMPGGAWDVDVALEGGMTKFEAVPVM